MRVTFGPFFLLFVIFLILKLADVIAWSWWWVTAPLWIPFLAGLVIGTLGLIANALDR